MSESDTAVGRYARPPDDKTSEKGQPIETMGCFGVRRSANGLSVMLDLRWQSGDRYALPYSHLVDLAIHGGATITATFTTAKVIIQGRRLAGLYDRLAEQRVAWIQETDRIDAFGDDDSQAGVVQQIQVETDTPGPATHPTL